MRALELGGLLPCCASAQHGWDHIWTSSLAESSNTLIHCQPRQKEIGKCCAKTWRKITAFLPGNHLGDVFCFALIASDTVSYIATCQIMSKL